MSLPGLDQLHKEVADLIDQLENSDIIGNTIEERTIYYLNRLAAADKKTLDREFADLKHFWLSSIDWCSELSRQIEKLIIMHEDLGDDETKMRNNSSWTPIRPSKI